MENPFLKYFLLHERMWKVAISYSPSLTTAWAFSLCLSLWNLCKNIIYSVYRLDNAKKSPYGFLHQHSKYISATHTFKEFHYWFLSNLGIMPQTSLSSYNNKFKEILRWNVLSETMMIMLNNAMNHSLVILIAGILDTYMLPEQSRLSFRNGWAAPAKTLIFTILLHKNIKTHSSRGFERSLHSAIRCTAQGRINYTSIIPKTFSHPFLREFQ